jgi:hypothetical protein
MPSPAPSRSHIHRAPGRAWRCHNSTPCKPPHTHLSPPRPRGTSLHLVPSLHHGASLQLHSASAPWRLKHSPAARRSSFTWPARPESPLPVVLHRKGHGRACQRYNKMDPAVSVLPETLKKIRQGSTAVSLACACSDIRPPRGTHCVYTAFAVHTPAHGEQTTLRIRMHCRCIAHSCVRRGRAPRVPHSQ